MKNLIPLMLMMIVLTARAQETPTVYATGLTAPMGLEVDARGRLWVAEQGTGNDDGRISIVTPDGQVHPFLIGLRSAFHEGMPVSAYHLTFHDGSLWAAVGLSPDADGGYILRIDTTGFRPGDAPFTAGDAERIDIGTFVLAQGFAETNVYDVAFDDDGNLHVVDAAANAVIKRDAATGALSVLATFGPLPNPTPVGPPFIDVVPTSILFSEGRLFVGSLTGFPFLEGMARLYEVGLDGSVSVYQDGLTLVTDLAIHPANGHLAVLQMGRFGFAPPPPGFRPHTGSAVLLHGGMAKTLTEGLNMPLGMRFDAEGNLYVATLADGEVRRLEAALVTSTQPQPETPRAFVLGQNYPNPFNPTTTIPYTLQTPGRVRLSIYNLLGQEIAVLMNAVQPAGTHVAVWDGRDSSGLAVASGVYEYRLSAADQVHTRVMALVK